MGPLSLGGVFEIFATHSSKFIWGFALLFVAFFILYSLLLLYHWIRYGEQDPVILMVMALYFGVSLVLIITLFISAFTII